ncbi:major sperm protein domain-containing protein [Cavenderia fasciculata]|uniref:Major sperm protein domain-containing protein n=1 Tax=Cavenderia fasciculata TaxID=261658 RepID=F4QFI1_CACFS|nr:major sperm protein domain-containing protein [Cavenderia fasciculata]EGG14282.1 major sperm protein domain-containing protein [Cavenderia fasciculata]|eukprot:XP_004350991.1 major sperm protein domain-containing protein [Cavenderia fasciculata]
MLSASTPASIQDSLLQKVMLKLRPKELVYNPPFQGLMTNILKLQNVSDKILAYKVKTTAPAKYCVRPNTGIIPPGETIDVQIILNCTKDMPSMSVKTKDKFQIQSTVVSEVSADPKLIWSTTPVNLIIKQRLKAVFASQPGVEQLQQSQQQQQTKMEDLSVISNQSLMSSALGHSDSEDEKDNFADLSTITPSQTSPTVEQGKEDSQIRKRPTTTTAQSNNNNNPSSSSSTNQEKDSIEKENASLTNELQTLKVKLETMEKQLHRGGNNNNNNNSSQTQQQQQQRQVGGFNFSLIQTLLTVLLIAAISFYFVLLLILTIFSSFCFGEVEVSAHEYNLPCLPLTKSIINPNNVTKVRPNDIKVVMAIGDSLTAGFALTYHRSGAGDSYIGESRGRSFSLGGDSNIATIPNFLKQIGANTIGQSYGRSLPLLHLFPEAMRDFFRSPSTHKLNAAVSQANLYDVQEQMLYLKSFVDQVQPPIDIIHDWKLINYFIGANDICDSCDKSKNQSTIAFWQDNYLNSLSTIREYFPRTIVNVILVPQHLSDMSEMGKGEFCRIIRDHIMQECKCAKNSDFNSLLDTMSIEYNNIMKKSVDIINNDSKLHNIQFRAIIQPFLSQARVKRSFLTDFDCFHFSEIGGQVAAIGLW